MLNVVEAFVASQYEYLRLDGTTAVSRRMQLIDEYNNNPNIFLFLLTTRAGGLGVNLTGANRVLLIDPDWNPANDLQARERAYRIGQQRQVTIYRLVTSGTLEEKVYQRQIFKQFLSDNVLANPKQSKRIFKPRQLRELFSRPNAPASADGVETADLFSHAERTSDASCATSEPSRRQRSQVTQAMSCCASSRQPSEETSFLSQLLDGDHVVSALDHDAVVGGISRAVGIASTAEARHVAERAAAAVRESCERRNRDRLNVPTWTGRSGGAGIPSRRFGSSSSATAASASSSSASTNRSFFGNGTSSSSTVGSAAVLQRIRERQGTQSQSEANDCASTTLVQLCDFFRAHNGRCTTTELVQHFQSICDDRILFKQLLREAACKQHDGSWTLKAEFV